MRQLENLPEITEKALGGLTADQVMKERILAQAEGRGKVVPLRRKTNWAMPAVAAAAVLALTLGIGIPQLTRQPAPTPDEPMVQYRMMLSAELDTDELNDEAAAPAQDAILMITRKAGSNTKDRERADLNGGTVTLRSKNAAPAFQSIWAEPDNGSFPMLLIDGRCYRQLQDEVSLPDSMLNAVGTVSSYTNEPALVSGEGIISNAASVGTTVYEVRDMGGTLAAASVNGRMKTFQRVSFNGSALRGKENLADTLQISGHITAIELSDVGVVDDANTCESLLKTLTKHASYESNGTVSAKQSLIFHLDNGLSVQMLVKGERLAACGVWSCPDFFDAFRSAVGQ